MIEMIHIIFGIGGTFFSLSLLLGCVGMFCEHSANYKRQVLVNKIAGICFMLFLVTTLMAGVGAMWGNILGVIK